MRRGAADRLVTRFRSPIVTTVEYEDVGTSTPGRQCCRPAAGHAAGHVGIGDHRHWLRSAQPDGMEAMPSGRCGASRWWDDFEWEGFGLDGLWLRGRRTRVASGSFANGIAGVDHEGCRPFHWRVRLLLVQCERPFIGAAAQVWASMSSMVLLSACWFPALLWPHAFRAPVCYGSELLELPACSLPPLQKT